MLSNSKLRTDREYIKYRETKNQTSSTRIDKVNDHTRIMRKIPFWSSFNSKKVGGWGSSFYRGVDVPFFETFNIFISYIFPENFIEIPQVI